MVFRPSSLSHCIFVYKTLYNNTRQYRNGTVRLHLIVTETFTFENNDFSHCLQRWGQQAQLSSFQLSSSGRYNNSNNVHLFEIQSYIFKHSCSATRVHKMERKDSFIYLNLLLFLRTSCDLVVLANCFPGPLMCFGLRCSKCKELQLYYRNGLSFRFSFHCLSQH